MATIKKPIELTPFAQGLEVRQKFSKEVQDDMHKRSGLLAKLHITHLRTPEEERELRHQSANLNLENFRTQYDSVHQYHLDNPDAPQLVLI